MTPRVDLGYRPRQWQQQCHRARKRFTVYALHRRAGKTELALMELIDKSMRFNQELGLFFYVAPLLKQARAIAWLRLKHKVGPLVAHGMADVNESELKVTFKHNGAAIQIYGADNPDAMRGVRLDGCVIDEVAQIKPEVWHEIIRPALSDRKGWALFIGTPNGINLFSQLYFGAQALADWHAARYAVYDTDALGPDEVENMRATMSETAFAREMLCDFSASGDDQLISLFDVEQSARRVLTAKDINYAPRIIGIDPARFGEDRSVIIRRQGNQVFEPDIIHGIDNMRLADRAARAIEDWQPDAVFCDAGNGSGVIDRLRQLGHDVIEVWFGGHSSKAEYFNKRAEMWSELADWIKLGGAIPNRIDVKQDLAAPKYYFDSQGKRRLESKDEIKKRGLPSTDIGDAIAVTFAQPVRPKHAIQGMPGRSVNVDRRSYDPYQRSR